MIDNTSPKPEETGEQAAEQAAARRGRKPMRMAMDSHAIFIRPLSARDSMEALTLLLHRAYAPLAALGIDFPAATQSADVTAQRAAEGQCFVAEQGGEPIGTVTVAGPHDDSVAPWFREPDTAHLHQFAVAPAWQGRGVGHRLVRACEHWALERSYQLMALDTPMGAERLRRLYHAMGYADVGQVHWSGTNYRSVVMRKALDESPLRRQLATMARYNRWATQQLLEAVDLLPEAAYRRAAGLFFGSVHGTLNHLLVADLLWRPRFAEAVSPVLALDHEAEPERALLRQRLLDGAAAWLPLLDGWSDEQFLGTLSYTRTTGEAMTLPFAATLMHVFNHGTHHRGQVSAALTALGQPAPVLDLVAMLQAEARPQF